MCRDCREHPGRESRVVVRFIPISLVILLCALLATCGGGSSSSQNSPPVVTSVTLTPSQKVVQAGQSLSLNAAVFGTGPYSSALTFSVNGIPNGDAANGTIANETYTAPAGLPSPDPVTIKATSVQDPTKSASVTLTVFTFNITPPSATEIPLVYG